jgi:DNA (cytosine-5)-methyltransferase 1
LSVPPIKVLDLFSAAAGGWSLGMHRAGFETMAACESVEWRRILYAQNNPGVKIYDDVCTLTAERLLRDIGELPAIIVGSPPCQDISSANTKGKGVEGERSGLFFEAVRLIGECRPRWFALENSANLRTRGADAVLDALEAIDYACWPLVVRAGDIGANHERPRSWLVGCGQGLPRGCASATGRTVEPACGDVADAAQERREPWPGNIEGDHARSDRCFAGDDIGNGRAGKTPNPDQAGQADGRMVSGLRQEEIAVDGRSDGRGADRPGLGQVAVCANDRERADGSWPLWSLDDLAGRLWLDDGLPARVAGTRVAVGGPRGTAAASLIVEAYGDAVVPQIPEAIGRAILRTEAALSAIYGAAA